MMDSICANCGLRNICPRTTEIKEDCQSATRPTPTKSIYGMWKKTDKHLKTK
jgi:hypothetical protein